MLSIANHLFVSKIYEVVMDLVHAGGNNMFAARANTKIAGILAAYPKKVESGKELKSVQGVGKGTMDKVAVLYTAQ